jgi:hypothetical protein
MATTVKKQLLITFGLDITSRFTGDELVTSESEHYSQQLCPMAS